jgi:hypothetical protein
MTYNVLCRLHRHLDAAQRHRQQLRQQKSVLQQVCSPAEWFQGTSCDCFPWHRTLQAVTEHVCTITATLVQTLNNLRAAGVLWQAQQCRRPRLAAAAASRPQRASGRRWSRRQPACPSWAPTAAPLPSRTSSRHWSTARQAALAPPPRFALYARLEAFALNISSELASTMWLDCHAGQLGSSVPGAQHERKSCRTQLIACDACRRSRCLTASQMATARTAQPRRPCGQLAQQQFPRRAPLTCFLPRCTQRSFDA